MIFTLLVTMFLSFFIFIMYKITVKDVPFSKGFAVAMGMISVVTASIILAIQSSIVISLGMVGALSIVRFRTAIKNPMDLLYLFWSISLGIITGAGLYILAIASSIIIAIGIVVYQLLPLRQSPHILIIKLEDYESEDKVLTLLDNNIKRYTVKSRSIADNIAELIIQIKYIKTPKILVRSINDISGVTSVAMLSHDGEAISE